METPVLLIIFNRPQTTATVFEAIRQAKPKRLFVAADGARPDRPGEAEKCAAARAIVDRVDWDCEVQTDFAATNLGCAKRPVSAIDWVFEYADRAIILEDDCLPHPDFFRFCDQLLDRYLTDQRITSICGLNIQFGRRRGDYSYYFSHHFHCWGWATWKRAWQNFDLELKNWAEIRDSGVLKDILGDDRAVRYWQRTFQTLHDSKTVDIWDYQCILAFWLQNGLNIFPNGRNLISNIGIGADATHTTSPAAASPYANLPTLPLQFPLTHPPYLVRHTAADRFTQNTYFDSTRLTRLKLRLYRQLKLKPTY
jgi:hypothetical protein